MIKKIIITLLAITSALSAMEIDTDGDISQNSLSGMQIYQDDNDITYTFYEQKPYKNAKTISCQWGFNTWDLFKDPRNYRIVAENRSHEPVGAIAFKDDQNCEDRGEIKYLEVLESYRKKGIGTLLWRLSIVYLTQVKKGKYVEFISRPEAVPFYLHKGAKICQFGKPSHNFPVMIYEPPARNGQ